MAKILVVSQFDNYACALDGLGKLINGDQAGNIADFMENPQDYDLLLFTGGADVGPELYGETSPLGLCATHPARDKVETRIFMHALKHGIKMTGICRGSQFINVMSGGRMIHDIQNHAIGRTHGMETSKGEIIEVNSFHHQMIIPPKDGHVIGWSKERLSKRYYGDKDLEVSWDGPETEIILIPRTQCCGAQWHPEWMPKGTAGYDYYNEMIRRFMEKSIEDFTAEYVKHIAAGA